METKAFLLNHFKVLQLALEEVGADASVDVKTFTLNVFDGDDRHTLYPQFLIRKEGKACLSPRLTYDSGMFLGWLPYQNRQWALSSDKLKFKAFCVKAGIATPDYAVGVQPALSNVLVKSHGAAPRKPIRGPFAQSAEQSLAADEFFESFISGRILKIWYWNGKLACIEAQNMPAVVGDGRRTLREILTHRLDLLGRQANLDELAEFLNFNGTTLESIIPDKQRCVVDFRYGSPYFRPRFIDTWSDASTEINPFREQVEVAGEILWRNISDEDLHNTLFTADAVYDANNKVWFLDVDANPFVHPLAYPHIFDSLFAAKLKNSAKTGLVNGPGQTLMH